MAKYTTAEVAAMLRSGPGKVRNVAPRELRTYAGRIYHSKSEAKYAFELDRQKSIGMIWDWEPQIALPIRLNGIHICNVVVDFRVKAGPACEWRYVEVKGFETEIYKLKRKLLLAMYGKDFNYEVVKV